MFGLVHCNASVVARQTTDPNLFLVRTLVKNWLWPIITFFGNYTNKLNHSVPIICKTNESEKYIQFSSVFKNMFHVMLIIGTDTHVKRVGVNEILSRQINNTFLLNCNRCNWQYSRHRCSYKTSYDYVFDK
jgi:hypothetical protein